MTKEEHLANEVQGTPDLTMISTLLLVLLISKAPRTFGTRDFQVLQEIANTVEMNQEITLTALNGLKEGKTPTKTNIPSTQVRGQRQ